jgi:hypothetical protein
MSASVTKTVLDTSVVDGSRRMTMSASFGRMAFVDRQELWTVADAITGPDGAGPLGDVQLPVASVLMGAQLPYVRIASRFGIVDIFDRQLALEILRDLDGDR